MSSTFSRCSTLLKPARASRNEYSQLHFSFFGKCRNSQIRYGCVGLCPQGRPTPIAPPFVGWSRRQAQPTHSAAERSRPAMPGSRNRASVSRSTGLEWSAALWPASRVSQFPSRTPFCRMLGMSVRLAASSWPIIPTRRASPTILRTYESWPLDVNSKGTKTPGSTSTPSRA